MSRYNLTDCEWRVIGLLLPNKSRGVPRVGDRRVLNGADYNCVAGSLGAAIVMRGLQCGGLRRAAYRRKQSVGNRNRRQRPMSAPLYPASSLDVRRA